MSTKSGQHPALAGAAEPQAVRPPMTLADAVAEIGTKMVACTSSCAGVARNQVEGIVPRGLYLEAGEEADGVIVCGMNPGNGREPEVAAYRESGASYPALVAYWKQHLSSIPYFRRVRRFVRALGYLGPILWTDVAKCERSNTAIRMSFATHPQTFRLCANTYLGAEIAICPESWPLIANGKDAFTALSYLFPKRRVVGIAHSTGAHPQFSKMWSDGELRPEIKHRVGEYFKREPTGALWLGGAA